MTAPVVEEILWTNSARITFHKIISWLEQEWSEKEVDKFTQQTERMLSLLKIHPEMCRPSSKRKNVRIGILDKHTQLVYHYKPRKSKLRYCCFGA